MAAMTEKQAQFRATLIDRLIADTVRDLNNRLGRPAVHVVNVAIADALPVPATVAEASAQIDALKSGNLLAIARNNRETWGPVVAKLQTIVSADEIETDEVAIGRIVAAVDASQIGTPKMGQMITADSLRRTIAAKLA